MALVYKRLGEGNVVWIWQSSTIEFKIGWTIYFCSSKIICSNFRFFLDIDTLEAIQRLMACVLSEKEVWEVELSILDQMTSNNQSLGR